MPLTKEEFEKRREDRMEQHTNVPLLKFLYNEQDKVFSDKELVEMKIVDKSFKFDYLVGIGYIREETINDEKYYIISPTGIKKMERKNE